MRKKIVFIVACFVCFIFMEKVTAQAKIHYAQEEENVVIVTNRAEFYEALCYQIREHKELVAYDTYENALGTELQDVFDSFYYHHNATDLVNSGSYLGRYIEDGTMQSLYGKFTGDHNCRVNVRFQYKYEKEEMDEYFSSMKKIAEELKGENDFESVKAVHDYLIRNYDYDDNLENFLDYEGYLTGTMVCQGYCMATFLLLADIDIPVRIVTGASQDYQADANHAWNVVKVDGQWYNMDVTWDDEGGRKRPNYTFFLKSDADFYKHTREGKYDYDNDMAMISYHMPKQINVESLVIVIIAVLLCVTYIIKRVKMREQNTDIHSF